MTIHQTARQLGSLATSFEFIYASGGEAEWNERQKSKWSVSCGRTVSKRTACNVRLCRGLHKSACSDAALTDAQRTQIHFDFVSIRMGKDAVETSKGYCSVINSINMYAHVCVYSNSIKRKNLSYQAGIFLAKLKIKVSISGHISKPEPEHSYCFGFYVRIFKFST